VNDHIPDSDSALLHKLGQRDEKAFVQVYERLYASVLLYAEKITGGDTVIAEDATADAFIELWKGNLLFSQMGQLISFLRKVAHHKCIDRYRQLKKQNNARNELLYLSEQQQEQFFFGEIFLEAEILRRVRIEVEKLPPHSKAVFKLAFFDGLSNPEIGQLLGITNSSVRRRKTEALQYLRKVFKGLDWELLILLIMSGNDRL
jgi:RNA polymerase sigma-70 factor (ECF subfamily)